MLEPRNFKSISNCTAAAPSALHTSGWDVAEAMRLLGDHAGAQEFQEHFKLRSSGA
jgi:hypothetical protein